MTMPVTRVVNYGLPGLINAVRDAKWVQTVSDGESFEGISLGEYCLCYPPDKLCSFKVEVAIRDKEDQIIVIGWSFPSILMAARFAGEKEGGSEVFGGPIKLAGSPLTKSPTGKNTARYEIDIQSI